MQAVRNRLGLNSWRIGLVVLLGMMLVACGSDGDTADTGQDTASVGEPAGGDEPGDETADETTEGEGLVIDGIEIADAELWAAAQAEGRLTLYSGRVESVFRHIKEAFEEQTGITITQVRLPGAQMFERVVSEYGAGTLDADYFDLSDLDHMARVLEQDMVISHQVPLFDELPDEGKDADGRFYVVWNPLMAIGYNSALVEEDEAPQEWSDLVDERWRGQVGVSHIDVGGSAWAFNMMLRERLGEDSWQELADNGARVYPSSVPLLEDVVRGEILVNSNGLSQLVEQQQAGAPIEIVFPTEGVAAFPTTGAIPDTAPHPNAARVWMNWITSPLGGSAVALTGAFGVHPDSSTPVIDTFQFPTWDELNVYVPTIEEASELRESLSAEWRSIYGVE